MADITPRRKAKGTVYEARFYCETQQKYRTKTFALRRDAATFLQNLPAFAAKEKAEAESARSPTIDQTLDAWLVAAETTGVDDHDPVQGETLRHYKTEANHVRALMLAGDRDGEEIAFKDVRLSELDGPIMRKVKIALLQAHSRKNAARCLSRLRFALNEAKRNGQLAGDPAKGVSITIGARYKEQTVIPEEDEAMAILRTAEALTTDPNGSIRVAWPRYYLMVKILISTGMRPSELRGFPRRAVNADFPMLHIVQKAEEDGKISVPKTPAARRDIRIPETLWHDIQDWMTGIPQDPETLLFGTDTGKAQSLANISNKMWWPLLRRAGIVDKQGQPKYILYSLRHFYASTEIAMGAGEKELQEAMGHEDITTTLNIYGHLFKRRAGGGQAARAEMRAKRLAGEIAAEPENQVVTFRRAS